MEEIERRCWESYCGTMREMCRAAYGMLAVCVREMRRAVHGVLAQQCLLLDWHCISVAKKCGIDKHQTVHDVYHEKFICFTALTSPKNTISNFLRKIKGIKIFNNSCNMLISRTRLFNPCAFSEKKIK